MITMCTMIRISGIFSLLLGMGLVVPALGVAAPDLTGEAFQKAGSLHVDGKPVGMEIAIDGVIAGQVDDSGVLVIDNIPVGEHVLTATHPDYILKEMLVNVPDGFFAQVRVELDEKVYGTLTALSTPPNVQLYVDDLYKGITPATLDLPTGSHQVLFRLAGYRDVTMPVMVTADKPAEITGIMEPIAPSTKTTPGSGPGILVTLLVTGVCCIVGSYLQRKGN